MKNELTIEPVEGRLLPVETNPRAHITSKMVVLNTVYYRRAIKRGDVVESNAKKSSKKSEGTK